MNDRLRFDLWCCALCGALLAHCSPSEGGPDARDAFDDDRPDVRLDVPLDVPRVDTDGDTIWDEWEGRSAGRDTDGDTTPDYLDTDSDDDTVPDADEAGDDDPETSVRDCDADGAADYVDTDSDDDGLLDGAEHDRGTSPCDADSDDDGVYDVVEVAYGSDPLDTADSPRTRGDFVFIVAFEEPPEPEWDTLVFTTDLQFADVYFVLEKSATMENVNVNLASGLRETVVPGIVAAIPHAQLGVAGFADCPSNRAYADAVRNYQDVTADVDAVQSAIDTIVAEPPAGPDEPFTSTLWVIATGDTAPFADYAPEYFEPHPRRCADASAIGWPCFRPGAVPILVQTGNEGWEADALCTPHKTTAEAVAAMNAIGARYIGISAGALLRAAMEEVATGTGSVDVDGNPLVFVINPLGTGVGEQVVEAVETLATQVPIDISAEAVDRVDGPGDTVDATVFIQRIVPSEAGGVADPRDPTRVCVGGLETTDADADTWADAFVDVLPGVVVCFDIFAASNVTVPPAREPQLFTADVNVLGDRVTILDTRLVYFIVPPETFDPELL
jgi:hypothetical protein